MGMLVYRRVTLNKVSFLRVELARYVRIDGQVAKDRRQAGQKTTQPLGKIVNK